MANNTDMTFRIFGKAVNASKTLDALGGTANAAAAGVGAAFAAVEIGSVISENMGIEQGQAKLTAQLALSAEDSQRYGQLAGELYQGAYGESLEQVNTALASVTQNVDGMREASSESLGALTADVLSVSETFDQDLGGVTRAIGTLMRTGLAKDAGEALDVITAGFQSGANVADDMLDTYAEYSTQFRKLGIDGATATGLIAQGVAAGARDADTVADALKEFSIRAIDGSDAVAAAYRTIGLDATKTAQDVAAGGESARTALQATLVALNAIEDPVARNAAAVALFGTKAEDLGSALGALDLNTAASGLGQVAGAAEKINETVSETTAAKVQSWERRFEGLKQEALQLPGPLGEVAAAAVTIGPNVLETLGPLAMLAASFRGMSLPSGPVGSFASRLGGVAGILGKGGLWGIAIVGGIAAVTAYAEANKRARFDIELLTDAIKRDGAAIGSNAKSVAVATLEKKGLLKTAEDLGVSLEDVTAAALGDEAAMERLSTKLGVTGERQSDLSIATQNAGKDFGNSSTQAESFMTTLGELTGDTDEAVAAARREKDALGEQDAAADGAAGAANDLAAATVTVTKKTTTATEATATYVEKLDDLTGKFLDARGASRDWEQAVDDARKAVKKNGETLDLNTQKGRDNDRALEDMVLSAQGVRDAMVAQEEPVKKINKRWSTMKQEIWDTAYAMTGSKAEADKYIASLEKIPKNKKTKASINYEVMVNGKPVTLSKSEAVGAALGVPIAGARASGGPVAAGSAYLVGEDGPELFVPGSNGGIIPNGGGGSAGRASLASGGNIYLTVQTLPGGEERAAREMVRILREQGKRRVVPQVVFS